MRWYLFLAAGALLGVIFYFAAPQQKNVHTAIVKEIAACAPKGVAVPNIFSCLSTSIRGLLDTYSTKEVMSVVATSSSLFRIYGNCHTIGHAVGQETYKKYGDIEKALSACDNSCAFACVHGAIAEQVAEDFGNMYPDEDIAHASGDEIRQIGNKYCSDAKRCHAIGHLLQISYNDLNNALDGCQSVSHRFPFLFFTCQGGVFMQAAGGLSGSLTFENEPAPDPEIPDNDYLFPCDRLDDQFQVQCFTYANGYEDILFKRHGITDLSEKVRLVRSACESGRLSKIGRSACFEGIGMNTYEHRQLAIDKSEAPTFCDQFAKEDDRKSCVLGRVYWLAGFISYTETANYCSQLNENLRDLCWNALFQFQEKDYGSGSDGAIVCDRAADRSMCTSHKEKYGTAKNTLPDYRYGLYGSVTRDPSWK